MSGFATKALPNLFSLAGKSIVVTGASGGMATAVSRHLLNAGAESLALLDMKKSALDHTREFLLEDQQKQFALQGIKNRLPTRITTYECDVSSQSRVRSVMNEVRADNKGPLNALVNTAGFCENISALDYSGDKIMRLLGVNLAGAMIVASEFARTVITDMGMASHAAEASNQEVPADITASKDVPHHRINNQPFDSSASIVLIGSMSGSIINFPQFQTPYNISKAGVIHLAKSLASEWAAYGIRVNSLSPGYIMTPLTRAIIDANAELKAEWESQIPIGRMAEPDEFAGPIIYLASDASSYMTGSDMICDGGFVIR